MYSVTFSKILQFIAIGIIVGVIIGFSAVLGFGLDGSVFVVALFLSIICVFLSAMYAELYHIREAVNRQRK
ncbi:hypothetical protein [Thalassobacillus sp. CUG 92003]|uniref:hypothetical protein n=1 Tax=Thalassobacillus sp. CUG 92003 TaxID=2736641 RepID=UPI0015E74482|nr:hypothetical protein [Thalassobacillus sp. CUG 92003]